MTNLELRNEAVKWVLNNGMKLPKEKCWFCYKSNSYLKTKKTPFKCIDCKYVYMKGETIGIPTRSKDKILRDKMEEITNS